jgi:transposase-like protein
MFEACSSKNGIAAREIERKYNVTPKTAWFMMHRIREAMKSGGDLLTGRVVADESWIGGDPKNRHLKHPNALMGHGKTDKTTIFTLVSRETGEVRSRVIPNVKGSTLRAAMAKQIDPKITHLHTDGWHGYRHFTAEHSTVDHSIGEYARGDVSTNQAENYFSQLKRSIDGTYHHVSREHLQRYLTEFDFRHSTCKLTDTERVNMIVRGTGGKRLTYVKPTRS